MVAPSAKHKGWHFKTTDSELLAVYNGVEIFAITEAAGVPKVGFFGTAPAARPGSWAITSFTEDKGFAGDSTTAADAVKAVASLVNDLISLGIIDGTVSA